MDTDPKLLPCPWCGGPAAVETNEHVLTYPKIPTEYFISCANEGTTCPVSLAFVGPCSTLQEAARRWNTRHGTHPPRRNAG